MAERLFVGIDIGGTKIAAALINIRGKIIKKNKLPTPTQTGAKDFLLVISQLIKSLTETSQIKDIKLDAIGIGVPGIVDENQEKILTAPNLKTLQGIPLCKEIEKNFKTKTVIGNDVNLGVLGEKWLGSGKDFKNIVGLFPGTGIGGGIIINNQLLTGCSGAAAELGHMIIDVNGPKCSCGNFGCLEALAGRWAIERDIREAIKNKQKTIILRLTKDNLAQIKSKILSQAIAANDHLTIEVLKKASRCLGIACISLKHIFDPEIIILGGGLIEACGEFMLPVIEETVKGDPLFKHLSKCRIEKSVLADDAVILGAVALAMEKLKINFPQNTSPQINMLSGGRISINGKDYSKDVFINIDGKLKKRKTKLARKTYGSALKLGAKELKKICKKKPQLLIIGSSKQEPLKLTKDGIAFLKRKKIEVKMLLIKEAIETYNQSAKLKTAILHLT